MNDVSQISCWIKTDPVRWELLAHVRTLDLPDCWVSAGIVRDFVWAKLHGQDMSHLTDVDVIWFDPSSQSEEQDRSYEARLNQLRPDIDWSVKNQARMHERNGDQPYTSSEGAMRHWPEVATAIAVRRRPDDECEVCAPFGVADLFDLEVRPTKDFVQTKRNEFDERVANKRWLERFPKLRVVG